MASQTSFPCRSGLLVVLTLAFAWAPAWADVAHRPARPAVASVDSLNRSVGPGETLGCESVVLTQMDVRKYFATATEVSGTVFHAQSLILPCSFSGQLMSRGKAYEWNINATGAGYLHSLDGQEQRRFLCRKSCQRALPQLAGL